MSNTVEPDLSESETEAGESSTTMTTGLSMTFSNITTDTTLIKKILNNVKNAGKRLPERHVEESEESEQETEVRKKAADEEGEKEAVEEAEVEAEKKDEDSEQELEEEPDEDEYELSQVSYKRKSGAKRAKGGSKYVKVDPPLSKRWPDRRVTHFDVRVVPFVMTSIQEQKKALYNAVKEICEVLIVVADKQYRVNKTAEEQKSDYSYTFRFYCHTFEPVSIQSHQKYKSCQKFNEYLCYLYSRRSQTKCFARSGSSLSRLVQTLAANRRRNDWWRTSQESASHQSQKVPRSSRRSVSTTTRQSSTQMISPHS